jgi:hypothetical protein
LIYDALETELVKLCNILEVQVPDIDLKHYAFCKTCGQPFSILVEARSKNGKSFLRTCSRKTTCGPACQGKYVKKYRYEYPKRDTAAPKMKATGLVACVCPRCSKKHTKEGPTDWRRYCPECDTAIYTGMIDMDLENDCREYVNG